MPRGRPPLNLADQPFDRLVAVSCLGMVDRARRWLYTCDCGQRDAVALQVNQRSGNTRSCGGLKDEKRRSKPTGSEQKKGRPLLDLTGQRYGCLFVQADLGKVDGYRRWLCSCDRGQRDVAANQDCPPKGMKKSCGCLLRDVMRNPERPRGRRLSHLRPQGMQWHLQGRSWMEIAERLGLTATWVWTMLHEAKAGPLSLTGQRQGKVTAGEGCISLSGPFAK